MVDDSVTAMALSPWGRNAALAGKRGLHIIDLDAVYKEPRWVRHLTAWEVADVQWLPHPARPAWVALTLNSKGILWNLLRALAHEYILHGHERAITDINFHNLHPDMLATSSVDRHCFVWDVRDALRRPAAVLCDWAGAATQVKWAFGNSNLIATAHGERIDVWDIRSPLTPLHGVTGHTNRVNGLSFDPQDQLVTCLSDGTVRTWLLDSHLTPVLVVECGFPVARARVLSMGHAMAVMPLRGGGNRILFLEIPKEGTSFFEPLFQSEPQKKPLCEFLWRKTPAPSEAPGYNNSFEMLTLGRDNRVVLYSCGEDFYNAISYDFKGPMSPRDIALRRRLTQFKNVSYREPSHEAHNLGRIDNVLTSDVNLLVNQLEADDYLHYLSNLYGSAGNDPYGVGIELRGLHEDVRNRWTAVRFEDVDVAGGKLVFAVDSPVLEVVEKNGSGKCESFFASPDPPELSKPVFLRVILRFKRGYPKSGPPSVHIEASHATTAAQRRLFEEYISYLLERTVAWNDLCLRWVFDFLVGQHVVLGLPALQVEMPFQPVLDTESDILIAPEPEEAPDGAAQVNVLQPITCGACWGPDGKLLVFASQGAGSLFEYAKTAGETGFEEGYTMGGKSVRTVVARLGFPLLIPARRALATKYAIAGAGASEIAQHNAAVADAHLALLSDLSEELLALLNIWNVVKVIVLENEADRHRRSLMGGPAPVVARADDWGFYLHLFGALRLVQDIMTYLEDRGDVQTLAMILCLIPENGELTARKREAAPTVEPDMPYDVFATGYAVKADVTMKLEVFTDAYGNGEKDYEVESLFDSGLLQRLAKYRDMYSNMLLTWGLPEKRVEMLKYNFKQGPVEESTYKTHSVAYNIETSSGTIICHYCCTPVGKLRIEVCHVCHHVFHTACSKLWFKSIGDVDAGYVGTEDQCPSGCGCRCLKYV